MDNFKEELAKAYIQEQMNIAADVVRNCSNELFGGNKSLMLYDIKGNFLFCYRTIAKNKNDLLNSFAEFIIFQLSTPDGFFNNISDVVKNMVNMEIIE